MSEFPETSPNELHRWSATLSGIARTGLAFTQNIYERERFEEVLHVAADIRAAAEEEVENRRERDHFVQEWMNDIGEGVPGYITPKVAVGANAISVGRGCVRSTSRSGLESSGALAASANRVTPRCCGWSATQPRPEAKRECARLPQAMAAAVGRVRWWLRQRWSRKEPSPRPCP